MNHPGPDVSSIHPLRDGEVSVKPIIDNPGFYRLSLSVMPHFQIEGMDIKLSLVGQLSSGKKN